jgi:para-aminobenzoate synthetase component 1
MQLPLVEQLSPPPAPEVAFRRLAARPHCLFLDSALKHPGLGRYSFLAADPYDFSAAPSDALALEQLRKKLPVADAVSAADLPPFQGGAAGLFGYDLSRCLEHVSAPKFDEFKVPALAVGFYDVVLAYDHFQDTAWLISQGWPEPTPAGRCRRAAQRARQFREWLQAPLDSRCRTGDPNLPASQLAPQFSTGRSRDLTSNFAPVQYRDSIQKAVDYIHAGDVFQVNLAQRLLHPAIDDPEELYLRLRQRNSATFAGYFDLGSFQILSASPERFLRLCGDEVEARPIKGTRQRTALPEADLFAADDLLQSEKDRAENVMIVDLMRNDLSRVCRPDSVQVTQLCEVEVYAYVQHLVSAVRGRLKPGQTAADLLLASFPAGSITGAPKVRAMEIISELEPTSRGPYCGSLGYIGGDGSMDLNVLIRTITAGRGWWQLPVGGGIVAQSTPRQEYDETWHKAEGMLRALVP